MSIRHTLDGNQVLVMDIDMTHLDASNVRDVKDRLTELVKNAKSVVLDMSSLVFVDSSGLGALISCLRLTKASGGDFRLCAMTPTVRALFELMRMHRVFNIYESRQDAIKSYG